MVRESKGILASFISTVQQNVGEISHLDCVRGNLVPAFNVHWSHKYSPLPGGLEPPTFRLTVERANQLRHGSLNRS